MSNASYRAYLRSELWARTRTDAIIIAGERCEMCGRKKFLQVHHLNYKNVGFEEPEDLIVLCARCHQREHGIGKKKLNKKKRKKTITKKPKVYKAKKKRPMTCGGEVRMVCPFCGGYLNDNMQCATIMCISRD